MQLRGEVKIAKKPCHGCGGMVRRRSGGCPKCKDKYIREWQQKNPDKVWKYRQKVLFGHVFDEEKTRKRRDLEERLMLKDMGL